MPHSKTKVRTHGCKLTVTVPKQVQQEPVKEQEVVQETKKVEVKPHEVKVEQITLDTMHDPVTGNNYTSVNGGCFALRR